jgi:hypothetical protein
MSWSFRHALFSSPNLVATDLSHMHVCPAHLWVCRPAAELLEPLPHKLIPQDVKSAVADARAVERINHLPAEPAAGCIRVAFHEKHDRLALDNGLQLLFLLWGQASRGCWGRGWGGG